MSLVNVAYVGRLTWANPALGSLEEQTLTPMLGEEPIELGLKGHEQEFLNTLRGDPLYQRVPTSFSRIWRSLFTSERVTSKRH
jgi:cytochrome c peroxidase